MRTRQFLPAAPPHQETPMGSMDFRTEQRQQQTLSPRLQHAVRLLQLSSLEFAQQVHDALGKNPFLEEDTDAEEGAAEAAPASEEAAAAGSRRPPPPGPPPSARRGPPPPRPAAAAPPLVRPSALRSAFLAFFSS